MKSKATHTTFTKGKRVLVFLRDGSQVIGRYVETKGGKMLLDNCEIALRDIRATTILKQSRHITQCVI